MIRAMRREMSIKRSREAFFSTWTICFVSKAQRQPAPFQNHRWRLAARSPLLAELENQDPVSRRCDKSAVPTPVDRAPRAEETHYADSPCQTPVNDLLSKENIHRPATTIDRKLTNRVIGSHPIIARPTIPHISGSEMPLPTTRGNIRTPRGTIFS